MANSQLLGLQKESTSPQPRTYVPIAPPIKAPTILELKYAFNKFVILFLFLLIVQYLN